MIKAIQKLDAKEEIVLFISSIPDNDRDFWDLNEPGKIDDF
jgi:hypothetical protein